MDIQVGHEEYLDLDDDNELFDRLERETREAQKRMLDESYKFLEGLKKIDRS